jgi:hypothetical protein
MYSKFLDVLIAFFILPAPSVVAVTIFFSKPHSVKTWFSSDAKFSAV